MAVKAHKKGSIIIGENQVAEAQEVHCSGCGRFLGFQAVVWGYASYKCPICKEFTTIEVNTDKGEIDKFFSKV